MIGSCQAVENYISQLNKPTNTYNTMFRSSVKSSGRRFLTTASSKTKYTSLSNGFTVATESNPLAKSSTVGLWIGAGSKFENPYNNGVSNVLTKIIVEGNKAAAAKAGIILGSSVEKESVGIYGTTLNKAGTVIDLIAKQIASGEFSSSAFESAKAAAIAEAVAVEEDPKKSVFEHLAATAFQKTPLALPTVGTVDTIAGLEVSDVTSFLSKHAVSTNAVIVGAGNINHDELVALVEKKISLPSGVVPAVEPSKFLGSDLRFRDDTLPRAYIGVAVEGPSIKSEDYYTAQVAAEVFGSYNYSEPSSVRQSSKLADIVHGHQLAETFEHFSKGYAKTGLWGFYTETSNVGNIDDLIHFSLKQWNRLSTDVTDAEVAKAKALLKTHIVLSLNSTEAIANDIGSKVLLNDRRASIDEIYKNIDEVTVKSVLAWAENALWDKDIAVSGTGQIEGLFDYNRLRNEMALLRW